MGHITLDLSVVFLCRREKRQFVFGTVTATCHPERTRSVSRNFRSRGVAERRKSRGACTPQGYETSLMFLFENKELFISNKGNEGNGCIEKHPIPSKNAGIFCFPFGFTPLTEVRRARRYTVLHSRNGSIPRLLRVTNGHSGSVPRGQPAGLVCSEITTKPTPTVILSKCGM